MMTAAFIGNLTGAVIFLVVVFAVIGAFGSAYFGWEELKMALLGKAYRPTFVLVAVGVVVIGAALWFL